MRRLILTLLLLPLGLITPLSAQAADSVSIYALFNDKAILLVDGNRRVLKAGEESPEGVRLISASTASDEAVIEVEGKRSVLKLGVVISAFTASARASTTLWAGSNGFFHADGSINGVPLTFLVDTGANAIAMNIATAQRVGIDYKKGQPGIAKTASGFIKIYGLTLESVKIGEIELHNVEAGVIEGPQPDTPLLGMSFLGRLEMRRDGDKMELIKKY
jgi:aspartyl protease family protein